MSKKKTIVTVATLIILLLAVTVFLIKIFDVHFNIVKYHVLNQDGYELIFKGSSNQVRKVIIKYDSKKICSASFFADPDVFSNPDGYSAKFIDINNDGADDIWLISGIDSAQNIYTTVLLSDSSGKFEFSEELNFLSNLTFDEKSSMLYTDEKLKEIVSEEKENSPEVYIKKHLIEKIASVDGKFTVIERRSLNYYSETDYCSYSIEKYDEGFKELMPSYETWFDPDESDKYPLNWN